MSATWRDDLVTMLKTLWAAGLSASQIAAELGDGVTRCAVLGKVFRLGLSGRVTATERRRPPRPPVARQRITRQGRVMQVFDRPPPVESEIDDAQIPVEQRRTLQQLTSDTCKWPVGDPQGPDFFFCGAAPRTGCVYCAAHERRARDGFRRRTNLARLAA